MTYEQVEDAAAAVRSRCGAAPDVAVVLGSGLGAFAEAPSDARTVAYADLPHWPAAAVAGHAGRLVVGNIAGRRVAVLAGRPHLYEGHRPAAVVFATRVMGRIGVRRIILTNAAGAVNPRLAQGALMIIDDHIDLTGANPLAGPNDDRFGPRFPDMTEVYSPRLRVIAGEAARAAGVPIEHGVYAAVRGPSYETPAEIRFLRTIGADAVGMSTVPEAIAARHMGIDVLGLSCITNPAAGLAAEPLTHDDVIRTARRLEGAVSALLVAIIERL